MGESKLKEFAPGELTLKRETLSLECAPVCMKTKGVVRSKVSVDHCAGGMPAPQECSCRCYSDVYWTCANGTVVCKAPAAAAPGGSSIQMCVLVVTVDLEKKTIRKCVVDDR